MHREYCTADTGRINAMTPWRPLTVPGGFSRWRLECEALLSVGRMGVADMLQWAQGHPGPIPLHDVVCRVMDTRATDCPDQAASFDYFVADTILRTVHEEQRRALEQQLLGTKEAGVSRGFEMWRRLHEVYRGDGVAHCQALSHAVQNPGRCRSYLELAAAMPEWQRKLHELQEHGQAPGDLHLAAALRRMMPEALEEQLITAGIDTYRGMLDVIRRRTVDASVRAEREPAATIRPRGTLATVEQSDDQGDLNALRKGKGKGKGCFTCGGDHFARECPAGAAKGAAGASAPKGGGKGTTTATTTTTTTPTSAGTAFAGKCFRCGAAGHRAAACPHPPPGAPGAAGRRLGSLEEDPTAADEQGQGSPSDEPLSLGCLVPDVEFDDKVMEELIGAIGGAGTVTDKEMEIDVLVDSGAAAHVVGPEVFPHPVLSSAGQRQGLRYTTASGERITNRGEQRVGVTSREGDGYDITFQVTDVSRPLLSVPRLTEHGFRVDFGADGGTISHPRAGKTMKFQRRNGVYVLRLRVRPPNGDKPRPAAAGFTRQGGGR